MRSYYQGNIIMAVSVLFSSNTFEKMKKYFELAAIPFVSKQFFITFKVNIFLVLQMRHGEMNRAIKNEYYMQ